MNLQGFLRSLVPGGIVLAVAGWAYLYAADSAPVLQAARGYPWVALLAAALIAARFQRSRAVAAALAMAAAVIAARPWPTMTEAAADGLACLLLALVFPLLALTDDRGVHVRRGLAQLVGVCVAGAAGAAAVLLQPERTSATVTGTLVDPWVTSWTALPQPALLASGIALAGILALGLLRARTADAGLLWGFFAATLAVATPSTGPGPGLFALAGGVALTVSIVEASFALAFRDELTGLPTRRALRALLRELRDPYAVAIVDVDRFKSFNDTYGHEVGDQVLRMVAARLAKIGGGGRAFRSGGEEFTVVFPGKGSEEAFDHVEALRDEIASAKFGVRGRGRPRRKPDPEKRKRLAARPRRGLSVTVSVGLAEHGRRTRDAEQVVQAADDAMYQAKKGGRNRVVATS